MNNLKKALMWLTVLLNLWAIPLKSFSQNVWCDKQDSLILDEMYRKSPTNSYLPWTNKPVSAWRGITLNDAGRVTSINFSAFFPFVSAGIYLPENIGDLNELKELYIYFRNTPPPSLAKLTKLQLLHLERGLFAVSGYSDISLLKDFSHIKEIYLNGIYFTGILTQNPNKDSLKTMTVVGSASRYSCDLSIFNDCPELSTLILYGVNFSNPKCELKNLPKLNQLEITYCNLAGEISLTNGIGSLKTLSLANNQLNGPIASRLPMSIESLNLMKNKFANELEPNFGELLPNLKTVNLSYNSLSGNIPLSVAKLKNLTSLNLQNNKFLLKHVDFVDSLVQTAGITFLYESQDSLYSTQVTFSGDSATVSIDLKEPLTNEMYFSWTYEGKVIEVTQSPVYKIYSKDYYPNGWYCTLSKRKPVGKRQYTLNQRTISFTPSTGITEISDSVTWQGNVVISGSTKITGAVNILPGTTITFEGNSLLSFEKGSRLYINTQNGDSIRFNYKKTSDTIRQPNLAYIYFNANSALKTSFNKCAFRGFDKSIVSVSANGVIANSTALFDNCSFNNINGLVQIGRLIIQNMYDYPVIRNSAFSNANNLFAMTSWPVIVDKCKFSASASVFRNLSDVRVSDCLFKGINGNLFESVIQLQSTKNTYRWNNSTIFYGRFEKLVSDRDSFLFNNVPEFECTNNPGSSTQSLTISNGYFTKDTLQKIERYTLGSLSATSFVKFSGNTLHQLPLIDNKQMGQFSRIVYELEIAGKRCEITNNKLYKLFTPDTLFSAIFSPINPNYVYIATGNEIKFSTFNSFIRDVQVFDGNKIVGNTIKSSLFVPGFTESFSNNLIANNEFTNASTSLGNCDTIANNTIIGSFHKYISPKKLVVNNIVTMELYQDLTQKPLMCNNINGFSGPDSYMLDPLFVKPVSFTGVPKNASEEAELLAADYHLKPNSPLIDAGKTDSLLKIFAKPFDADGNPRIQGNAIDIGCYEAPKANGSAKSLKVMAKSVSTEFDLLPVTTLPPAMLLDAGSDIYITKEHEAMLSPLFVKGGISPYTIKYMGESETLQGANPVVKAEDKTYILVVTDSCGCTATDTIRIFLSGTGIEPPQTETSALELNIAGITNGGIRFRIENSGSAQKAGEFAVYSIDGKLLCRIPVEPFNASAEVFVSAEYTQRVFVVQYRNNNTMVSRKVVFGK